MSISPVTDTSMECTICTDAIASARATTLVCGHIFHQACIGKWLERANTCPLCRADVHPPRARHAYGNPEQLARVRSVFEEMGYILDEPEPLISRKEAFLISLYNCRTGRATRRVKHAFHRH